MSIKKSRKLKSFVLATMSVYGFALSNLVILLLMLFKVPFSFYEIIYTGILPFGLLVSSFIIRFVAYRNKSFFSFNKKVIIIISFFLWCLLLAIYAFLSSTQN